MPFTTFVNPQQVPAVVQPQTHVDFGGFIVQSPHVPPVANASPAIAQPLELVGPSRDQPGERGSSSVTPAPLIEARGVRGTAPATTAHRVSGGACNCTGLESYVSGAPAGFKPQPMPRVHQTQPGATPAPRDAQQHINAFLANMQGKVDKYRRV